MNLLDDAFGGMPGEPARLDYIIREHEKLERRFAALAELLLANKVLSRDEFELLKADQLSDQPR
jgi:hypothetical protein